VKNYRLPIAVALLATGALAVASYQLPLVPTSALAGQHTAIHAGRKAAAPHSIKTAKELARQSVTRLAGNYAKGHAKKVCSGLTAKARKSLGGDSSCASKVRLASKAKPISMISIKKIVFRRDYVWADVSGYLNGNRKRRLAVALKWEGGRYRLDHSLSTLKGLFG
jgi:hypothetical protein